MEFPLSLVLAAAFLIITWLLGHSRYAKKLGGLKCSEILFAIAAVFLAVEGTWGIQIHRTWPFAMLMVGTMLSLGATVFQHGKSDAFTLSHAGIFVIIFGAFFGAPDHSECQLMVTKDSGAHIGRGADGVPTPLPFEVRLDDFRIDYYDDAASPKQFTSVMDIEGRKYTTSVNHPCRYKGYTIYQSGYDRANGEYSILGIVRDPWIPLVAAGLVILLAGTAVELWRTWRSRAVLPLVFVIAVVFGAISVARINFGTLMPALRSFWFIPHIMVYMLAYSVLAVSLLSGIGSIFIPKIPAELSRKLLSTASCLLLIGMSFGAVWAKAAWGDYWTWDAKENWAAVTWLLTLAGTHIPSGKNNIKMLIAVGAAFLAMQMTWYGVNWLPAAQASLHTYKASFSASERQILPVPVIGISDTYISAFGTS